MTDIRPVPPTEERLLTPEEASVLLGVTVRWLYRHAGQFTFTRKLSRKVLRFHEAGLRRYIERGRL
jgi:predicted DNA-binding transcriptional regulator AlpA